MSSANSIYNATSVITGSEDNNRSQLLINRMEIVSQILHAQTDHSSWSESIDENYDEDDALTIESFVAYFHNQYCCETADSKSEFQAERKEMDPNGSLIVVAKQGWKLFKKYLDLCKQYPHLVQEIAKENRKSRVHYNKRGRV